MKAPQTKDLPCRICKRPTPVEYRAAGELKRKIVTCVNCELRFAERAVGPLFGQDLTEGESWRQRRLRQKKELREKYKLSGRAGEGTSEDPKDPKDPNEGPKVPREEENEQE